MTEAPELDRRFADLVREHQAMVRTFVRMLGVAPLWVDDVAQEAFLVAYRRYAEFDEDGDFAAWVRGIARRLVANERRKEGRRTRLLHRELTGLLAREAEPTAPEALVTGEVHAALRACIEELPGHSRDLVRMRYEEDLDSDTMGAASGRDGNAVRQALFRVRELIRRCVGLRLGTEAWP